VSAPITQYQTGWTTRWKLVEASQASAQRGVFSDFFERVTVLERDAYPKDAADRRLRNSWLRETQHGCRQLQKVLQIDLGKIASI
jgi:hypothetical protein